MLTMSYAPEDAALAVQLEQDLRAAGYEVGEKPNPGGILVAVLSPGAIEDAGVQQDIIAALDANSHIIPVLAQPLDGGLPHMIDHLPPLDFSRETNLDVLLRQVEAVSSGQAGLTVKARTPRVQKLNRDAALVLLALALLMFAAGVYLVGAGRVEFPNAEYNTIYTEVQSTIDAEVNNFAATNLPRSTDEALNFPATVRAAPTGQRPFLAATATAAAGE